MALSSRRRILGDRSGPRLSIGERLPWHTNVVRRIVLAIFAVFWVVPVIWLVLAPSKTDNELLDRAPLAWGSWEQLGETWTDLYSFNDGAILDWALRSLVYALTALVIAVGTSILAGYGLATRDFAGKRAILALTLVTMILPVSATVLPLFLGMNFVGLLNTPISVILPMGFFPFGTYLAYIYYRRSLPPSLLEAASIDGASHWQAFRKVGLPLSKPLLGLLAFLNFTVNWNRFFLPFVMLNSADTINLPVGLNALVQSTSALRPTFLGSTPIKRPEVALASLILAIPVAIVFILAQKYVITGSLTGATKD